MDTPEPTLPATPLRSACDFCHKSKVKCDGSKPCSGCQRAQLRCNYSSSRRTGRPRGARNKRTLERLRRMETTANLSAASRDNLLDSTVHLTPPSSASSSDDQSIIETDWEGLVDTGAMHTDPLLLDCFDFLSRDVETTQNYRNLRPIEVPDTSKSSPSYSGESPREKCEPFRTISNDRESCECLQRLAALFVQLKVCARKDDTVFQAAEAFWHVREAVAIWEHHLQCMYCTKASGNESLFLSAMEIRMSLHIIRRISSRLDPGNQASPFIQTCSAYNPFQQPVHFVFTQNESLDIIRTLLARSVNSIVGILGTIKERASDSNPGSAHSLPNLIESAKEVQKTISGSCS
ncbi:hypothetical protein HIM_08270 [Hirsutella minnesotensis 3608]|uniref:Zn(2)-C6 fungal-type domain-containing protein n=1 Tax=Hirsutella minnesotensis 3608 TaxID=1043627 RepID=A0A0F8A3S6_9HYPO|nr:hypothetical protein HIM_08270 [Hirsutella minnesotensis 3608]